MDNSFLNHRLAEDSEFIRRFNLCELRLIKDGDLDWFILIPLRPSVSEIFHLNAKDQTLLIQEVNVVSQTLSHHSSCDKINIASIGISFLKCIFI